MLLLPLEELELKNRNRSLLSVRLQIAAFRRLTLSCVVCPIPTRALQFNARHDVDDDDFDSRDLIMLQHSSMRVNLLCVVIYLLK